MTEDPEDAASWLEQIYRGLGASTRHNALAYGFSLALTGTFGIVAVLGGSPTPADILVFGIGGSITFTLATALTTSGYRKRVREQPPIVRAVGSSLGFLSVTASLGSAWLVAWLVDGWLAWFAAAFVASAVYLVVSSFELALARMLRPLLPVEELEDPDDS